jgi:5-methylcytosine-specific restriction enzyme A
MTKLASKGRKLRPSSRALVRRPQNKANPFYHSEEWRSLIESIIRERGRICEDPQHDPATPRFGVRIFGDHVIELKDGGARLNAGNIMLRCGACHTRKTAQSRRDRLHRT